MLQFASSEMFRKLFADGMGLVEETASYLDGDGREASRRLTREASLSYATVSMEMTTRLMQAASWLVVQRAVQEGDMTVEEATEARFRLEDSSVNAFTARQNPDLPEELMELVERAKDLFDRLHRLDEILFDEPDEPMPNPVTSQLQALQDAANSGAFDPLSVWRK
ncbi:MAG: regulator of CtrA degradation rcdA [Ponticaulis sp.]|nr:regulator of CtrA degradation rcdA [Ponticaulis sp.]